MQIEADVFLTSIGKLQVCLLEAIDIIHNTKAKSTKSWLSKSNRQRFFSYCSVGIVDSNDNEQVKFTTATLPYFTKENLIIGEEFLFDNVISSSSVAINLYSIVHNTIAPAEGECLGSATIPVSRLGENTTITQWYQLHDIVGGEGLRTALKIKCIYTTESSGNKRKDMMSRMRSTMVNVRDNNGDNTIGTDSRSSQDSSEVISSPRSPGNSMGTRSYHDLLRHVMTIDEEDDEDDEDYSQHTGSSGLQPSSHENSSHPSAFSPSSKPPSLQPLTAVETLKQAEEPPDQDLGYRRCLVNLSISAASVDDSTQSNAASQQDPSELPLGLIDYCMILGPTAPYTLSPSHKFNASQQLERLSLSEYQLLQHYPRMVTPYSNMEYSHSTIPENALPTFSSMATTTTTDGVAFWSNAEKAEVEILDRLPRMDLPDMVIPNKVEWFACPQGSITVLSPTRPNPFFQSFVLTSGGETEEIYGVTCNMYFRISDDFMSFPLNNKSLHEVGEGHSYSLPTTSSSTEHSPFHDEFYHKETTKTAADGDGGDDGMKQIAKTSHLWTVVTICWIFRVPYYQECLQLLLHLYNTSILSQFMLLEQQRDQYLYEYYEQIESNLTQSSQGLEPINNTEGGSSFLLPAYYYLQQRLDLLKSYYVGKEGGGDSTKSNQILSPWSCLYIEKALASLIMEIPLPITNLFNVHIDCIPHFPDVKEEPQVAAKDAEKGVVVPESVTFIADNYQSLPTLHHSLAYLLQLFPPRLFIDIYCFLLNESRIIFLSQDLGKLTVIGEGFRSVLYPLHWTHVYIPIVPIQLMHLLEAPVPFVLGFHTQDFMTYLEQNAIVRSAILSDLIVVNCDTLQVQNYYDGFDGESSQQQQQSKAPDDDARPKNMVSQRLVLPYLEDTWLTEGLQCLADWTTWIKSCLPLSSIIPSYHERMKISSSSMFRHPPFCLPIDSPAYQPTYKLLTEHLDVAIQLILYDLIVHFLRYIPDCLFYLNSNCLLFNRPLFLHDYTLPEYTDFLSVLSITNAFHELTEHFYHMSYFFFNESIQRIIDDECMYWNHHVSIASTAASIATGGGDMMNLSSPSLSVPSTPRYGAMLAKQQSTGSTPRNGAAAANSLIRTKSILKPTLPGLTEVSEDSSQKSDGNAAGGGGKTKTWMEHKKQLTRQLSIANLYQQQQQQLQQTPETGSTLFSPTNHISSPARTLVRASSTIAINNVRNGNVAPTLPRNGSMLMMVANQQKPPIIPSSIEVDTVRAPVMVGYSMSQDLLDEKPLPKPATRPPLPHSDSSSAPYSPIYPQRLTSAFQQLDQDFFGVGSIDSCDYGDQVVSLSASLDFGMNDNKHILNSRSADVPNQTGGDGFGKGRFSLTIDTTLTPSLAVGGPRSPIFGETTVNQTVHTIDQNKLPAWITQGIELSEYYDARYPLTIEQLIAYRMSKYLPLLQKEEKPINPPNPTDDVATSIIPFSEKHSKGAYDLHIPLYASLYSPEKIRDRIKQQPQHQQRNSKMNESDIDIVEKQHSSNNQCADDMWEESGEFKESLVMITVSSEDDAKPIHLSLSTPDMLAIKTFSMNNEDPTYYNMPFVMFDPQAIEMVQQTSKLWNIDALRTTLHIDRETFIQLLLATEGITNTNTATNAATSLPSGTPIHQILSKHYQQLKQQYNHQQISFLSSTTTGGGNGNGQNDGFPSLSNQSLELDPQVLKLIQMIMTMQPATSPIPSSSMSTQSNSILTANAINESLVACIPALEIPKNRHALLHLLQQVKRDHHHPSGTGGGGGGGGGPTKPSQRGSNGGENALLNNNTIYPLPEMILENLSHLFYEILQICLQQNDYSTAYTLLEIGGHFFQIKTNNNSSNNVPFSPGGDGQDHYLDENEMIEFLSEKIQHHPIYQSPIFWKYILDTRLIANTPKVVATKKDQHAVLKRRNSITGMPKEEASSVPPAVLFAEIRGILYMMLEMGVNSSRAMNFIQTVASDNSIPMDEYFKLQRFTMNLWSQQTANDIELGNVHDPRDSAMDLVQNSLESDVPNSNKNTSTSNTLHRRHSIQSMYSLYSMSSSSTAPFERKESLHSPTLFRNESLGSFTNTPRTSMMNRTQSKSSMKLRKPSRSSILKSSSSHHGSSYIDLMKQSAHGEKLYQSRKMSARTMMMTPMTTTDSFILPTRTFSNEKLVDAVMPFSLSLSTDNSNTQYNYNSPKRKQVTMQVNDDHNATQSTLFSGESAVFEDVVEEEEEEAEESHHMMRLPERSLTIDQNDAMMPGIEGRKRLDRMASVFDNTFAESGSEKVPRLDQLVLNTPSDMTGGANSPTVGKLSSTSWDQSSRRAVIQRKRSSVSIMETPKASSSTPKQTQFVTTTTPVTPIQLHAPDDNNSNNRKTTTNNNNDHDVTTPACNEAPVTYTAHDIPGLNASYNTIQRIVGDSWLVIGSEEQALQLVDLQSFTIAGKLKHTGAPSSSANHSQSHCNPSGITALHSLAISRPSTSSQEFICFSGCNQGIIHEWSIPDNNPLLAASAHIPPSHKTLWKSSSTAANSVQSSPGINPKWKLPPSQGMMKIPSLSTTCPAAITCLASTFLPTQSNDNGTTNSNHANWLLACGDSTGGLNFITHHNNSEDKKKHGLSLHPVNIGQKVKQLRHTWSTLSLTNKAGISSLLFLHPSAPHANNSSDIHATHNEPIEGPVWLASGTEQGHIGISDCDTHQLINFYEAHASSKVLKLLPTRGHEFLSCGVDRYIKLWDIRTKGAVNHPLNHHLVDGVVEERCLGRGVHKRSAVSPITDMIVGGWDNTVVLSTSADGFIKLWDLRYDIHAPCTMVKGHTGRIVSIQWKAGQESFVTAGDDGIVNTWDCITMRNLHSFSICQTSPVPLSLGASPTPSCSSLVTAGTAISSTISSSLLKAMLTSQFVTMESLHINPRKYFCGKVQQRHCILTNDYFGVVKIFSADTNP